MTIIEVSVFLSLVLRHKPSAADIEVDEHGWARVDELIAGVNKAKPEAGLDMPMLEEIVRADDKSRYSFSDDMTMIRANQGHSIPVDVELEESRPPRVLYHGTAEKYVESIEHEGLIKKTRLYVHLSGDFDTAVKVGERHGELVVYLVYAEAMASEGYKFYLSKNGVWLTDHVPARFISRMPTLDENGGILGKSIEEYGNMMCDKHTTALRRFY